MKKTFIIFSLLLFSSLFIFSIVKKKRAGLSTDEQQSVLVSIPAYHYFVERIAGNTITIHTLVPPGSDPHFFEPTPHQMQELMKCNLWVRIGDPSEGKIWTFLQSERSNLIVLNLSKALEASLINDDGHCCESHGWDPHFWLSPKLAHKQAELIAQELIALNPKHKQLYKHNLNLFLADLNQVDREIEQILRTSQQKSILVAHPAFTYFCRDYHIHQLSLEQDGKDPLPKQITRTMIRAVESNVAAVLTQPQHSGRGAEIIAKKLKLPLRSLDPYDANYLENLKTIAQAIAQSDD